jgi:hypothetical protein
MVKAAAAAGGAGDDDLQLMQVIVSLTDAHCGLHNITPPTTSLHTQEFYAQCKRHLSDVQ